MPPERTLRERITRTETLLDDKVIPILEDLKAAQAGAVTEAQCRARCPDPLTPWDYVKRAVVVVALVGGLSSGAAGWLHLMGKEIRDIAEPSAHAGSVVPRDAGR